MTIHMGLDLSTTCTGGAYFITHESGIESSHVFSLDAPKKVGLDERIEYMRFELSLIIDTIEKTYGSISLVCIEAVPFMNRQGSSQLNDLNGVIRNMLLRRSIV